MVAAAALVQLLAVAALLWQRAAEPAGPAAAGMDLARDASSSAAIAK